jgi:hypothetical protein
MKRENYKTRETVRLKSSVLIKTGWKMTAACTCFKAFNKVNSLIKEDMTWSEKFVKVRF